MEFNDHKPIYLQIADNICEKILSGEWPEGDRIPSVRELGSTLGVNPNTIMRTYEHLTTSMIIYNKRGVGYFVEPGSKQKILTLQRTIFINEELPAIIKKMEMLGLTLSDLPKSCIKSCIQRIN
jgi:DNA-binding transcriptional regulator YhcF (GntR family)